MGRHYDWIAVDWGTSHMRLWLMDANGGVIEQRHSDQGMGKLSPEGFEPALMSLIGPDMRDDVQVVCCGMVGARQGWQEAPYASVPCAPPTVQTATSVTTRDARLTVHILPGVSQMAPPDVMRGEETQIAGYLAEDPDFDGILCLPGTHNKWVHLSAGEIVSFRTFMTGEMFALLGSASVLRHSVAAGGWDDAAFARAINDAMSRPANIAADLFGIRAASLLQGTSSAVSRARLSGLLIGMELAAARPYWLGQKVRIIGEGGIASAYNAALSAQGVDVATVSADDITLRGLRAAYDTLKGAPA